MLSLNGSCLLSFKLKKKVMCIPLVPTIRKILRPTGFPPGPLFSAIRNHPTSSDAVVTAVLVGVGSFYDSIITLCLSISLSLRRCAGMLVGSTSVHTAHVIDCRARTVLYISLGRARLPLSVMCSSPKP